MYPVDAPASSRLSIQFYLAGIFTPPMIAAAPISVIIAQQKKSIQEITVRLILVLKKSNTTWRKPFMPCAKVKASSKKSYTRQPQKLHRMAT